MSAGAHRVGVGGRSAQPVRTHATQYQGYIDVYEVAGWGLVDDVIDPRDTRKVLAWGLELAQHKKLERPYRKRGVMPV